MLRMDPNAWAAGFAAGQRGEACGACPYASTSAQALAWVAGFIEGKASRAANPAGGRGET
ncbi:hypothetical protein LMG23992_02117 [Cupriavidus laharis]|uniref:Uncharacterized protein n=1 Tax=Cupriavidus laharis TaxID=151654 RepID=A0ABM8WX33_9BURK|nr:Rmf/CrpP family protein [Cupriavidus laharis]CAG9172094.1 hypothetical protein LMG23992_02117 [Cupriavidus laharis]